MKELIIVFTTLYVISIELNTPRVFQYKQKPKNYSLETALMTGNKSLIKPKTKKSLKELALLHLFTPSGLHFSSVLALMCLSKKLRALFIILSFVLMSFLGPLYALKRVILFYFINLFIKNTKWSFILTFLLSLIFSGYTENPLSYLFSFIFWYSILSHRFGKIRLILYLFFIQCSIAMIMNNEINFLSLFINPILTMGVTILFPILLIVWITDLFSPLRDEFYSLLESFIHNANIEFFQFIPSLGFISLLLLMIYKKRKLLIVSLLCFNFSHMSYIDIYQNSPPKIYPLRPDAELIKENRKGLYYVDRICKKRKVLWRCKKKPSIFGGLSI